MDKIHGIDSRIYTILNTIKTKYVPDEEEASFEYTALANRLTVIGRELNHNSKVLSAARQCHRTKQGTRNAYKMS